MLYFNSFFIINVYFMLSFIVKKKKQKQTTLNYTPNLLTRYTVLRVKNHLPICSFLEGNKNQKNNDTDFFLKAQYI